MNLGGEPERDDSGLPPVDIEIPDDARELDRDVQAYRRELRALRRRQRRMRLHGPLTGDGIVLPLLASCLVLALIAGTLLTVFASGQPGEPASGGQTSTGAATTSPPGSPSASPSGTPGISEQPDTLTAHSGAPLPDAAVRVDGSSVHLRSQAPVVVALLPAGCGCTAAARRLIQQSLGARLKVYLFGAASQLATVQQLAEQAPADQVSAGQDPRGALNKAYPQHSKLTALLIQVDGAVRVVQLSSTSTFRLNRQLTALEASRAAAASTSPTTAASSPAAAASPAASTPATAASSPATAPATANVAASPRPA